MEIKGHIVYLMGIPSNTCYASLMLQMQWRWRGGTRTVNVGVDGRDAMAVVPFILVPARSPMLTTIAMAYLSASQGRGHALEVHTAASTASCLARLTTALAVHRPKANPQWGPGSGFVGR